MRLKTFVLTYLLFLCILFSSIGMVSVYLTNSQMNMLKDKSEREYQTISATLARDIAVLYGRSSGASGMNFSEAVETFVNGYARYYSNYGIDISLTDFTPAEQNDTIQINTESSFIKQEQDHFIYISGMLPEPFHFYRLEYYSNITESIADMQNIQRSFLFFSVLFSIITAFALYFILASIFKPLGIIADTSRKIADGLYGERIQIKGENELSAMAYDFNRMAEIVENQIRLLEEEAVSKQQFIDNFAHEIRTPLTSIYGYAEYIQKAPFDEAETIESTQFIMDEANHMKKIANSLLELATLRNYTPDKVSIPIRQLFESINQAMKKSLDEKNIRLICENDVDVMEGQEDLIKSLLMNLCFNAVNACAPNDGVICLEAKKREGGVVLSVSDNGCGIADADIAKITEPFYRVDKARSREHGGAGLGLALCRQIAGTHGAEMAIESSLGAGTKVKIFFTSP